MTPQELAEFLKTSFYNNNDWNTLAQQILDKLFENSVEARCQYIDDYYDIAAIPLLTTQDKEKLQKWLDSNTPLYITPIK